MRIIMPVFRSFSFFKFNTLCFFGLMLAQPTFATTPKQKPASIEPSKQKVGIIETNKKSTNNGKTDSFNYTHTFYREKTMPIANGKPEIKREYVTQTLPGEELIAVATFTYTQDKPASEVVFTLPLPKEAMYVEGSATDEKYVWFSVDNGKNWSRYRDLRVTETNGTKRIATGKDVTNLQWRMASPLQKGDTGKLEYKIIIR
jgi:hypothetical protein